MTLHLIAIGKRGYCLSFFDFTIAGSLVSLTFKSLPSPSPVPLQSLTSPSPVPHQSLSPGSSTLIANNAVNLSNCGHTTSNQSVREQPKTTADHLTPVLDRSPECVQLDDRLRGTALMYKGKDSLFEYQPYELA